MQNKYPPAMALENVATTLKWYNSEKGFGFVKLPERDEDAFLHASQLADFQAPTYPEGMTIVCDVVEGQKGLQVSSVYSVDRSAVEAADSEGGLASDVSAPMEGSVKFFNSEKGFGFITLEEDGKDVFIASRILERCGLMNIESRQRVMITMREGDKGLLAESIELL